MASKARRKQRSSPRPARAARVTAPARDGAPAAAAPPGRVAASASGAPDPAPEQAPEPARGWVAAVEHETMGQVLMATCWLDPGEHGPAGTVTVRFTGRRAGITGAPGRGDRFEREEIVEGVLPGSGPVSVTTRVTSVTAGEWLVRARVVARPGQLQTVRQLGPQGSVSRAHVLRRILWPKGNPVAAGGPGTQVSTRMAALATGPGIVFASWSATVAAGVVLALGLLVVLLGRVHIGTGPALAVSTAVILAGIIGARAWYVMLQRGKTEGPAFRGLCIQGTVPGGRWRRSPGCCWPGSRPGRSSTRPLRGCSSRWPSAGRAAS